MIILDLDTACVSFPPVCRTRRVRGHVASSGNHSRTSDVTGCAFRCWNGVMSGYTS